MTPPFTCGTADVGAADAARAGGKAAALGELARAGMPAVVGCGDATKRIRTGDRIRVDGDRGTVRVLESA